MGRKQFKSGYKIFDAVALSGNQTSSATNVESWDKASILVEWSAGSTPVGTLTVEVRYRDDGNWVELDMGSAINISGNSGNHQLVFNELPFKDLRLVYTRSSGDATMTATIAHKTVGA